MSKINPSVVALMQEIKQHSYEQTMCHIEQLNYIEQCLDNMTLCDLDDARLAISILHKQIQLWKDEREKFLAHLKDVPNFVS